MRDLPQVLLLPHEIRNHSEAVLHDTNVIPGSLNLVALREIAHSLPFLFPIPAHTFDVNRDDVTTNARRQ